MKIRELCKMLNPNLKVVIRDSESGVTIECRARHCLDPYYRPADRKIDDWQFQGTKRPVCYIMTSGLNGDVLDYGKEV